MGFINEGRHMRVALTISLVIMSVLATPSVGVAAEGLTLGTASTFAILAGTTITNTGPTTISGDIGLDPGADPTITTFPGQELIILTGTVHLFDAVAQQAKADLVTAYNEAVSQPIGATISADLGGSILTPGVYTSATSMGVTGTLTLDGGGDSNAVFIFQAGSTLTTATGSEIRLINGAQASGVFWQVGSSATLGTDSVFVGTILAMESITATTRARVHGQLLARNGAVTLDTNVITVDAPASLTVTKVVTGDVGDMVLPSFGITVTGPGGFTATRTFTHGESFTWENLAPGAYTVAESRTGLSSEWTVTGEGIVQVVANQAATATVTNAYLVGVQPIYGALTVTKTVSGNVADMVSPSFALTVTGPEGFLATRAFLDGETFTWANLTPGTYTVTESRTGLSSEWTVSGEGALQVVAAQTAVATITNSYIAGAASHGALTVTKTVSGNLGEMALPLMTITVTGPEGFSATRTFVHGESFTWANLVPGVYTVTESRTDLSTDWTVTGEGTVQVMAEHIAMTTITNSYFADAVPTYGALTVTKVVSGNTSNLTLPLMTITVTGPEGFSATRTFINGESFTWQNLIPGAYTVTESQAELSNAWTVSGEGTVQVLASQTPSVTISNAYLVDIVIDVDSGAELPDTGENTSSTTYAGFLLFGLGLLLWKRK